MGCRSAVDVTEEDHFVDRAAEVLTWLERRADEMAALLEELVAIDTENPPGRGLGRCGESCATPWRGSTSRPS